MTPMTTVDRLLLADTVAHLPPAVAGSAASAAITGNPIRCYALLWAARARACEGRHWRAFDALDQLAEHVASRYTAWALDERTGHPTLLGIPACVGGVAPHRV